MVEPFTDVNHGVILVLGSYPSGCLCVEHLISRKFPKMKWKLYYLYDMEDMNGISSFRYALKNCGVETLQKFLAATPQPHRWYVCLSKLSS